MKRDEPDRLLDILIKKVQAIEAEIRLPCTKGGYIHLCMQRDNIRNTLIAALTGSDRPMKSKEPYTHEAIPLDSGRVYILPINPLASDPPLTDEQQVIKYLWEKLKALTGSEKPDPEALARLFHETYERLAPEHGYVTREETRVFDKDSPNGKLMIAVCEHIAGTWRKVSP